MRELKDYTAELHRRIEEKQEQQRRTRRRITALCVPLALALTVTAAVTLPKLARRGARTAEKTDASAEIAGESLAGGILETGWMNPEQNYPEGIEMDPQPGQNPDQTEPNAIVGEGFALAEISFIGSGGTAAAAALSPQNAARLIDLVQRIDPFAFVYTEGPADGIGLEPALEATEEIPEVWLHLTDAEGFTAFYTLTDHTLVRGDTGARFPLTEAQYAELLKLIGFQ